MNYAFAELFGLTYTGLEYSKRDEYGHLFCFRGKEFVIGNYNYSEAEAKELAASLIFEAIAECVDMDDIRNLLRRKNDSN